MPSPTASVLTRALLGGSVEAYDLEAARQGYIAHKVLRILNVGLQAATFGRIPLDQLLMNRETCRTPGAGYSRSSWRFTPDSYACQEQGAEEPVDDRQAKMYGNWFNAAQIALKRARNAVLLEAERRVAAQVFDAAVWTGTYLTTAVVNEWDDAANATPIHDVNYAANMVFDGCAMWPNALIINRRVYKNVINTEQIIERVHSYGAGQSALQSDLGPQILARALDLDYVFVAGAAYNTAAEGQTAVPGIVWSNEYAMVCRVATSDDITEPCIGRTFHYTEDGSDPLGTVETYREEQTRSDIIRVRHDVDEKMLITQAGHLLSNITT